jgi:glutathione S-transferase
LICLDKAVSPTARQIVIKLFYAPGTCALAPHIVLEWIGEPYELEKVKLGDPEYKTVNPMGKVPALIDGNGSVMTQADAILKYLVCKYPDAQLGDDGTLPGAFELNRWLAFFTGDVHPAFYPFFRSYRYSTDQRESSLNAVKEAAYLLVDTVFSYLDQHLAGREYIVGDRRTIADPYAFSMIRWGTLLPKPLADYSHIYRFFQQFQTDAGVKRAMAQEGLISESKSN